MYISLYLDKSDWSIIFDFLNNFQLLWIYPWIPTYEKDLINF